MNDTDYYIAFFKSKTVLDKVIRFFSKRGSGLEEYSHVVFVHKGEEISLQIPRILKTKFRKRSYNLIYKLVPSVSKSSWDLAMIAYNKEEKYGTWQVIGKAFTMIFGLRIIKARRDCAEFILDCVYPENKGTHDFYTVGQVHKILTDTNKIIEK